MMYTIELRRNGEVSTKPTAIHSVYDLESTAKYALIDHEPKSTDGLTIAIRPGKPPLAPCTMASPCKYFGMIAWDLVAVTMREHLYGPAPKVAI